MTEPGYVVSVQNLSRQYALDPLEVYETVFDGADPDSLIAVGSRRPTRRNPEPHPVALTGVPVRARREWLPEIFKHAVEQTLYFSPTTLKQEAVRREGGAIGEYARLRWIAKKNVYASDICGIILDLDSYKEKLTAGRAMGQAVTMVLEGYLPLPALGAYSGQGAYLLWLLQDVSGKGAPKATRFNVHARTLIAAELVRRTAGLGGDPNATSPVQWYKSPGTVDTKTGYDVVYMSFVGQRAGQLVYPRFTLPEIGEALNLYFEPFDDEKRLPPKGTVYIPSSVKTSRQLATPRTTRKAPTERKRNVGPGKGGEPHRRRAEELEALSQIRGGFREGTRHWAVWLYYAALKAYRRTICDDPKNWPDSDRSAAESAVRFARQCRPPYPKTDVYKKVIAAPPKKAFVSGPTAAGKLQVTKYEVDALGLQNILPGPIYRKRKEEKAKQAAARKARRIEEDAEIAKLYMRGVRKADIARRLGKHKSTIGRRIEHLGIKPASRQQPLF